MKWFIFPIIALLCVTIILGCSGNTEETIEEQADNVKEVPQLEQETDTSNIEEPELTIEDDFDVGEII